MDFKKKWQHFWTLDRHHAEGFTLVELIIVIAILAILSAVAVPAYNGYIKKANDAADQVLLDAVNKAFASACMEAQVDAINVTTAEVSVIDNKINNLSKVESEETPTSAKAQDHFATISDAFIRYYVDSNPDAVFKGENINSLQWNDVLDTFEIKADYVDTLIMLEGGKSVVISAASMEAIQNSAFADMGYEEVAEIVNTLGDSSETLVSLAKTIGLGDRFSNVLVANGLIEETAEADAMTVDSIANGLQMVTGKRLAGATSEEINELATMEIGAEVLGYDLGTFGVLKNLAGGDGGTNTVAALATQYALAQSFSETEAAGSIALKGNAAVCTGTSKWGIPQYEYISYDCSSIEEFLNCEAAKADPVWALKTIQGQDAYKEYTQTEQYTSDLSGFVGTMSILGDNIGTVDNPGAIGIDSYFKDGINSSDAANALTQVLGK